MLQRKRQVSAVFRRQRRNAQRQSRKIDAFVLAERAAINDFANHLTVLDLFDAQFDEAVR